MKINRYAYANGFAIMLKNKFGWSFGKLLNELVIKHDSFHFVIDSFDELVKVIEMMDAIPPQETRDLWHEKVKKQLTNIERAKALVADYQKAVVCEYKFLSSPMADTMLSQNCKGFIGDKVAPMSRQKSA